MANNTVTFLWGSSVSTCFKGRMINAENCIPYCEETVATLNDVMQQIIREYLYPTIQEQEDNKGEHGTQLNHSVSIFFKAFNHVYNLIWHAIVNQTDLDSTLLGPSTSKESKQAIGYCIWNKDIEFKTR